MIKRTKLTPNGLPTSVLAEEYTKCKADPIYFIKKYCKLSHPIKGSIPFDLYDFQEQAITEYQLPGVIVQPAARQTGKTHVLLAYICWFVTFKVNKTVLHITNTIDNGLRCRNILVNMLDQLPAWLKLQKRSWNKRKLEFENGSNVCFERLYGGVGIGLTADLVVCDEFSYCNIKQQEDFYYSILPAVPPTGTMIMASSIGITFGSSFFSKLCKTASEQSTKLRKVVWKWNVVPSRDESFKAYMIKLIGSVQWNIEYELAGYA